MLPYINIPFIYVAGKIGASPDELKLLTSFLLSYPLAALLKRVPDARPVNKNLFIIAAGLFYLVGLFDLWTGLRTLFISSAAAYGIAYFMRGSSYMPWAGFIFLMGHMSANQLVRQWANDPATIDITGAQMVLVIKLSAFCWNVADGMLPDDQLSDFQRDRVLRELPGLLDYAGYVLFFPSLLVGPAFDFAEYRRWIDTSMFDVPDSVDPAKRPPTRRKRRIPRSGTPAMWKMAQGLGWILVFLQFGSAYDGPLLTSDAYMEYSFPVRVFFMYLVGVVTRLKYYGVWTLAEGACILTGLGYNGVDPVTGRVSWNRAQNVNAWGVETAQNTRAYLENWNMKTNAWLRNYVYLRVTARGKKPGFRASMVTFTTSAFWHGMYPGYYLTFILASVIQTVAKNFRRYCRPFFLDPVTQAPLPSKRYYDMLSFLATQLVFSFTVTPFVLLTFKDSFLAWSRVYFYAIIGVAASMAFFASPARPALRQMIDERARRAGVAAAGTRPDGLHRTASTDSVGGEPVLGVSSDPQKEIDDIVRELREFRDQMGKSKKDETKTE